VTQLGPLLFGEALAEVLGDHPGVAAVFRAVARPPGNGSPRFLCRSQREGRILGRGNVNPEVDVIRYVSEGSSVVTPPV
jgi:hypothetical protein